MASTDLTVRPSRTDTPDGAARTVLATFPAGAPRGSRPAEEFAAREGATVVMDLASDSYLVVRGR
ncbi:hypothetical protein [Streptomyces sp. DW26H14]|uniref:hypothetical protein n=1 Tax=Streptomyces sp. DW26H14 TaxID=3435395 RepID=UPI00403DE195